MVKKVLIAVDGSDHAAKAVAFGADIAAKYGAELVLVHILLRHELPRDLKRLAENEQIISAGRGLHLPGGAPAGLHPDEFDNYLDMAQDNASMMTDILREIGTKILDNAETAALDHGVGKIVKRIVDGEPVDQILDIAKSENVDLIVTGGRGLSTLKGLFFGSVSQKVAQHSPVACLTVR